MAQRKRKRSRRQAEARRRWQDLHAATRKKYTGPWKRRDRRREAVHTMNQRVTIVRHYQALQAEGRREEDAAQQTGTVFGWSASSVHNYARTWRKAGKRGLLPTIARRVYRPNTPWEVIQIILLVRRLGHWGGDRIAAELKGRGLYPISGQGVDNLLKRYRLYPRTYHPIGLRKGIADRQWDVTAVNAVWHLDLAGPFVTQDGHKWWVLLGMDTYSRLLLTLTVVTSLDTQTVCDHLTELFEEYGLPNMLVTDNGLTVTSVWEDGRHAFPDFLKAREIEHHRLPADSPEANGKAEAAVKIGKREALAPFFKAVPTWNVGHLQRLLTRLQTDYNCHRLHGGIGWRTPAQLWFTTGDEPPKQLENLFFIKEPELQFAFC